MPSIILPRRFTQQPQYPAKVDPYWASRGLTHAYIGGLNLELVHGTSEMMTPDVPGKSGRYNKGTSTLYRAIEDTAGSTIIGNLRFTSNNGDYGGFGWGFYASGADTKDIAIGLNGTDNQIYAVNRWDAGHQVFLEASVTLPYEAVWALAGVWGDTANAYKNGVFVNTVAAIGAGTGADSRKCFRMHISSGKSSAWRYRFASVLTAAEIKLISDNPEVVFRREPQVLYFSATSGATLTPSLYTDTDTFYAATVTPGAVTLTPAIYSDADTFYAATVSQGAAQTLTPSLYADADTFHAATVAVGYNLQPPAFADGEAFYAATVTTGAVSLTPSLYSDADTFYAASVAFASPQTLTPSLMADADTFYAPTVSAIGWSIAASASGTWTDQTPASGSWVDQ